MDASASLDLEAAADCATRTQLIARVATRSQNIQFVAPAAGVTALRVTIHAGARATVVGELGVSRPGGKRSLRRIVAPSCREAVDALALIVAITLDPAHAIADPAAVAATGAMETTPVEPPSGPSTDAAPPAPTPSPAGPEPSAAGEATPAGRAQSWLAAGAGARVMSGAAPRFMPGVAVHLAAGLNRASIWSPAARLSVAHVRVGGVSEPGGTADFTLDAGTLDACPLLFRVPRLEARACAAVTAGRLTAQGSNTFSPRVQGRPFVTLGGSLLAAVALSPRFELVARLAAGAPLVRDAFQFSPEVFYRVGSVTLEADLGLAIRFP